jgi:hypothetical protein
VGLWRCERAVGDATPPITPKTAKNRITSRRPPPDLAPGFKLSPLGGGMASARQGARACEVLSYWEFPQQPVLELAAKMKQAPSNIGACAKVVRISGLAAAAIEQRQHAQTHECKRGGFGNCRDGDVLEASCPAIARVRGIIRDLEIAPQHVADAADGLTNA